MESRLELVACERANLRLTASACARFWTNSNPVAPPVWQGAHKCHQCPAGAARCGVVLDPLQALRDRLEHVCVRCRRFSDRIISARLCVCCYNRENELKRGRNAKGYFPARVAAGLSQFRLIELEAGVARPYEQNLAVDRLEMMLARARRATAPVAFGWAPPIKEAA